jgi:hypothetical protein
MQQFRLGFGNQKLGIMITHEISKLKECCDGQLNSAVLTVTITDLGSDGRSVLPVIL